MNSVYDAELWTSTAWGDVLSETSVHCELIFRGSNTFIAECHPTEEHLEAIESSLSCVRAKELYPDNTPEHIERVAFYCSACFFEGIVQYGETLGNIGECEWYGYEENMAAVRALLEMKLKEKYEEALANNQDHLTPEEQEEWDQITSEISTSFTTEEFYEALGFVSATNFISYSGSSGHIVVITQKAYGELFMEGLQVSSSKFNERLREFAEKAQDKMVENEETKESVKSFANSFVITIIIVTLIITGIIAWMVMAKKNQSNQLNVLESQIKSVQLAQTMPTQHQTMPTQHQPWPSSQI